MASEELDDFEKIGPLKVLRAPGENGAATIVLFHGFGANAHDLYPLHDYLPTEERFQWIFPQGLLEVPLIPGYSGRAWFPIDMQALQEAISKRDFRDLSSREPEGLDNARMAAFGMIEALGIPWENLILGGFSQGAMLACDVALRAPRTPKGLVLFSGALLNESVWSNLAKARIHLRFFQSHGEEDPILDFNQAKKLEALFRNSGMLGEFIGFRGGHEIPPQVLQGVSRYLNGIS